MNDATGKAVSVFKRAWGAICLLMVLLVLVGACWLWPRYRDLRIRELSRITATDVAVYRTALEYLLGRERRSSGERFGLVDRPLATLATGVSPEDLAGRKIVPADLARHYERRNRYFLSADLRKILDELPGAFAIPAGAVTRSNGVVWVQDADALDLPDDGEGYFAVSLVGYDETTNTAALLVVRDMHEDLWFSWYIVLTRREGQWVVTRQELVAEE